MRRVKKTKEKLYYKERKIGRASGNKKEVTELLESTEKQNDNTERKVGNSLYFPNGREN
jgi:hypothetical protein